jgi:hypothetical protein
VLESVILVQRWQGEAKIRYLTLGMGYVLGRNGLDIVKLVERDKEKEVFV